MYTILCYTITLSILVICSSRRYHDLYLRVREVGVKGALHSWLHPSGVAITLSQDGGGNKWLVVPRLQTHCSCARF
jgi:hypothetical protein